MYCLGQIILPYTVSITTRSCNSIQILPFIIAIFRRSPFLVAADIWSMQMRNVNCGADVRDFAGTDFRCISVKANRQPRWIFAYDHISVAEQMKWTLSSNKLKEKGLQPILSLETLTHKLISRKNAQTHAKCATSFNCVIVMTHLTVNWKKKTYPFYAHEVLLLNG